MKANTYQEKTKLICKSHPGDRPEDWIPVKTWRYLFGAQLFVSDKMIHYHTKKLESFLTDSGSMAKVGNSVFLHKDRFFSDYQKAMMGSEK